jgi:Ca2+-binding RTX toxin-like protein
MAINYLTQTELGQFLDHSGNVEASVQSALFNSLQQSGVFQDDDSRTWLESGSFPGGAVPPVVQVLDVTTSTSVETDPALKAIIQDDAGGNTLNVTGGNNDVFVAMGNGRDSVHLLDSGNDTIVGGSGDDVISGGKGNSSLFGGAGDDILALGSGNDTLNGGSGDDSLVAGTGVDSLIGGAGNDLLSDGVLSTASGHNTLSGGTGNDTMLGTQGDIFRGGSGNDVVFLYDGAPGANSTLSGGSGNDTFLVNTHTGNDTIFGGSGDDTVTFTDRNFSDVSKIDVDAKNDTFTLHFNDNQTIAVSGVEEVQFNDQVVTLPKL